MFKRAFSKSFGRSSPNPASYWTFSGIEIKPLVAGLGLFLCGRPFCAQDLFKNLIAGILIIGENLPNW